EASLERGDSAAAQTLHAAIEQLHAPLGAAPAALERRLAPLHARFAELRRWQHWSTQRRRRALCDEIEALAATSPHPDAIANRVRGARAAGAHLDTIDGGVEAGGLARRFHGVCQRALKPARAYFEKRDALRKTHADEIEALLARAAAAGDAENWKAQAALRR